MLVLCGLFSCDEQEAIPSYIYIDDISLRVNSNNSQGSNAEDIIDAWVYLNGQLVGVYETPATIPILAEGKQQVTILAGIKKNGLSNQRIAYPFYDAFDEEIELIPAFVDSLDVEVTYRDNAQFSWLEDFEDGTVSMQGSGILTSNDSMIVTDVPSEVFEYDGSANQYSGKVDQDLGFQIFENSSVQLFDLPRSGQEIFLEFNYKSESEFVAGIYPISGIAVTGVPIVNFFSTEDDDGVLQWKKAYVSLKEDVNNPEYNGFDFKVFFNYQTNDSINRKKLYLDNIKLIHF